MQRTTIRRSYVPRPFATPPQFTPLAGPSNGGTQITITGTNLGVKSGDIASVSVGSVPCSLDPTMYIPGIQ